MERSPKPHLITDLRPTLAYFVLAAITIALGIVLRFIPMGLPYLVPKYGGSALWAVMVYFLFAAILPHSRIAMIAGLAILFSGLLEISRLYHRPALDAFRLTLAGALLLGRVYDRWHLVAYTGAILVTALIDKFAIRAILSTRPARPGSSVSGS